jgi:hypothetical protein
MKILKVESWKIFMLIVIVPIVTIVIGSILLKLTNNRGLMTITTFIGSATLLYTYLRWIWSAGVSLYKIKIAKPIFNIQTFKLLFSVSLIYSFILAPILIEALKRQPIVLLFSLLKFVSLLCFLYCVYFVATLLINIENHSKKSVFWTFLSIWFLPFGIWGLHQRLKKIFENNDNQSLA